MTFLTPAWLALGGLTIIVFVLHMRRRRQLDVPSVLLWRSIENTGAPRRTIRWPPPSLLLALQLLIILLVAAALAQPLFGGDQGESDHTIYVIDASASMRATDVAPDRFGNAIETLTDQLNGVDPDAGNRFSVVVVDANPRIHIARQEAPGQVVSVLAALDATDGPADWNAASDLIASLFVGDEVPKIVILSDGADPAAAGITDTFPNVAIERAVIGNSGTVNLGVVANLLETDAEAGEWLLTGAVTFTGIQPPDSVSLTVLFRPEGADRFLEWDEVEARRGGAADDPDGDPIEPVSDNFVLQLQLPGPGEIRVELPDDDGAYDNVVNFNVRQEPATARVLYLGPQSLPLVAAFLSMDSVDLVEADQLPDNDADFDLVIVDNVTVPRRPATNVLWVGVGRLASASEPTGLQSPSLSGWNAGHPLSEDVTWAGIEPSVGYRIPRLSGSTVLLESGGTPLIQARTRPSGREISIAFDIVSSNWPELTSFPVFISNVVSWLGKDVGTNLAATCLVGQPCPVESRLLDGTIVAEDGTAVWSIETAGQTYLLPGIENSFVPTLAGLYRLEADEVTRLIIVDADAAGETSLAAIEGFEGASVLSVGTPRVWWWLLLAALLILVLETLLAGRGSEHFLRASGLDRTNPLARRRRVILATRVIAIAFLVAAIAGLPWLGQEPVEDVVVVLGADLGPGDQNADRDGVLQQVAENAANGGAGGGLITAGNTTEITGDLGAATAPQQTTADVGANLEEALLLAAAMVPSDRPGRIVLATDGNETEGDLALAFAALSERGITVDIQAVTDIPQGEVLIEQIDAPPRVFAGDIFPLEAVIYAQEAGEATVSITRAGEAVLDQSVELLAGRTMVQTLIPAGEEGNLLIEVTVTADSDTYAQNNTNGLIVEVKPPPAILIVTPQPVLGEYFAQALSVQGREAEILTPAEAPTTLEGWLEYESVVLMNVPAIEFDTENQEYLEELVRTHGRGLLILGGENSFGPGGYYQTPFEDLSPLSARIEHEAPEVAVVFVLDRSSSMGGMIGDRTRLDIAKQATVTAISLLHESARVGIVVFDSDAYPLVTLTAVRDDQYIADQLLPVIEERGGTNMFPGLVAALSMLAEVDAATKHIIVLTDGATNAANFDAVIETAIQENISISAVGIGAGQDRRLIQIADFTGGAFHETTDFRALPAILSQEALTLANSPFREIIAPVQWANRDAEFLAGLPDVLPPIYAFVQTTAKPTADLHMTLIDDEGEVQPLMASWRYGNGHVLAFATHGAGAGTAEWIQMPEYPLLWSQILRHFLPDADPTGLNGSLERAGDAIVITADVLGPDDLPVTDQAVVATLDHDPDNPISLVENEPGRYVGQFTAGVGAYSVTIATGDETDSASIYVAYPARFNFGRADFDKLQALAAMTGGQLLLGGDPIFSDETQWVAQPGWRIWALVALVLFMLDLTIRHAPALFGLRRVARRPGPAIAVPAE